MYLKINFQVDWTLTRKVIKKCLKGTHFKNVRFWKFLRNFWKFEIEFLENYPMEWAVTFRIQYTSKRLAMCKVSEKSEMVGEIIGCFDMELLVYIYMSILPSLRPEMLRLIEGCLNNICRWFNDNKLICNRDKTSFLYFTSKFKSSPKSVCIDLNFTILHPTNTIRKIGGCLGSSSYYEKTSQ